MQKYHSLASSMVTCHDELLDSLEGLECLIYEGVYLVNFGNLRRALVSLRRASTLAQFMGMHRKDTPNGLKQHDPGTRVSGDVTWVHIAYLERYVSLLLDMSTSITNTKFASDQKRAGESDAEWLEKMQVDLCEQIINRNQRGDYDLAATQLIDETMNRAANSMPANWWKPMEIRPGMTADDVMALVVNAQMQIIHYNLLTVLHLPFLLRKNADHRYDYNKTVCMYASREVLNRYIAFRSVVKVVFCCRPVDFCALTASLVLLLAHLSGQDQNSTMLLTHQRPGDRALIEKTVETLDELNRVNHDELTRETANLVRKLLVLETDSLKTGDSYSCAIVNEGQVCHDAWQERQSLCLRIPYFGTVMMAPDISLPALGPSMSQSASQTANSYTLSTSAFATGPSSSTSSEHASGLSHTPSSQSDDVSLHVMHLPHHLLIGDQQPLPSLSEVPESQVDGLDMFDLPMPDIMADTADWAFQGVDVAFFNSLLNGQMVDDYQPGSM